MKVECGRAGCLPEAVFSQESLFFLKQSENCTPPGRDYSSAFQYSPGYWNNWVFFYNVTIFLPRRSDLRFLFIYKLIYYHYLLSYVNIYTRWSAVFDKIQQT